PGRQAGQPATPARGGTGERPAVRPPALGGVGRGDYLPQHGRPHRTPTGTRPTVPEPCASCRPCPVEVIEMAKTLIDIDDELLRQAQRILGASTKKATVNAALREVVRRDAAARFLESARGGVFGEPQAGQPW